jgi:hypothetical protein
VLATIVVDPRLEPHYLGSVEAVSCCGFPFKEIRAINRCRHDFRGLIENAESDPAISLELRGPIPRFQWHGWIRFCDLIWGCGIFNKIFISDPAALLKPRNFLFTCSDVTRFCLYENFFILLLYFPNYSDTLSQKQRHISLLIMKCRKAFILWMKVMYFSSLTMKLSISFGTVYGDTIKV